tara:strand:+ start:362 stop:766 length:405 start_codon:yes stop_codon:yes gene_type:complete
MSVLLAPAIAAKGFVDSAITINVTATAALSTYGGAIAPAVTALASATTSVTTIQTALIPIGATTAPPFKIGLNITGAILAQIVTVNATIVATTTQSVATLGAPSPTFPASAALVDTQLKAISVAIQNGLILPQQ